MRLLALAAGILVAATIVPGAADAGPVRAAAAGTATAVAVTGKTAVRGTVVVGRSSAGPPSEAPRPPAAGLHAAQFAWRLSSAAAGRLNPKPHSNSASDSAASTPPVIAISANGVLSAISASVTMICPILAAISASEAP
jgi:hypothetical protein